MLTPAGLQIKKLPDMIPEVIQELRQNVSSSISVNDSDPLYQTLVIFLNEVDRLWQLGQAVSDSDDLDKAEGVFLDNLGAISGGITRNLATRTAGVQYFRGQVGTTIPAGTILENTQTQDRYVTASATLSTTQARETTLIVSSIDPETIYNVTVNGVAYVYTTDTSPTVGAILNGIKAQMDADLSKNFSVEIQGQNLVLATIVTAGINTTFTSNISATIVVTAGTVSAEDTGPFVANANSITRIITPVAGLVSTYNPAQLSTGRNRETDELYRDRIKSSRLTAGKATLDAIASNLRNTPGVSYASVIENDTMEEDVDGRPPKSIEPIVDGGTDEAVGSTILFTKGAGVSTFGNTTVVVEDQDGQSFDISFSRPVPQYIAVRVSYSLYDEEQFPTETGPQTIRQAVVNYTNSLGLDKDIFPGRYFGPIYNAVDGVGTMVVEIQEIPAPGSPPDEGEWTVDPIPVGAAFFAQTTITDVTVIEV